MVQSPTPKKNLNYCRCPSLYATFVSLNPEHQSAGGHVPELSSKPWMPALGHPEISILMESVVKAIEIVISMMLNRVAFFGSGLNVTQEVW